MILRTAGPRAHHAWTSDWWAGSEQPGLLFGSPPSPDSLARHALAASRSWAGSHCWDWTRALAPVSRSRPAPPKDALIVLAGQQPCLGGGAALVVHKAATAVALAREATRQLRRPVIPVFLLATQDHDSFEVDHLDFFDNSNRCLVRIRCRIAPDHEMFCRAKWNETGFRKFRSRIKDLCDEQDCESLRSSLGDASLALADHPARLIDAVFGDQHLLLVEAHRLEPRGRQVLSEALEFPARLSRALAQGAHLLREQGTPPAFDPADPRPLVLESRNGQRTRVAADDLDAGRRLAASPADFSPHAALRPIVQALSLPVLAQVVGPSEILYLAQARGLHDLFHATPPLLVPRMEATRLPVALARELGEQALDLYPPATEARRALELAAARFTRELAEIDPGLQPKLERFARYVASGARRLAAQPNWRGKAACGKRDLVLPRGRVQDSVLAWLPDAWSAGDPSGYGRFLTSLCRPIDPPAHVIHTYPDLSHG